MSGILIGIIYVFALSQIMIELVDEISSLMTSIYGVPYDLIHEQLSQIISIANFVAPIIYPVQYSLIGALFGLLQQYLMTRLKTSLLKSIMLAGVVYALFLGVVPILTIQFIQDPLLTAILRKLGFSIYVYSVMPAALFTLFLYIIHFIRGPWSKVLEAKPKEY